MEFWGKEMGVWNTFGDKKNTSRRNGRNYHIHCSLISHHASSVSGFSALEEGSASGGAFLPLSQRLKQISMAQPMTWAAEMNCGKRGGDYSN
jgi:hypothetical protein